MPSKYDALNEASRLAYLRLYGGIPPRDAALLAPAEKQAATSTEKPGSGRNERQKQPSRKKKARRK